MRIALSTYPNRRAEATPERMAQLLLKGNEALAVVECRLGAADWLAGNAFSLADIALYAYSHRAAEGGFGLALYPGIRRWLARVAALPGHVTIAARPPN